MDRAISGRLEQLLRSECRKYTRINGDTYFGGTLVAVPLRNSSASSSLAATASTTTGSCGSNGGTIVLNTLWTYQYQATGTYPATLPGRNDYNAAIDAFFSASSSDGGFSHQGSKANTLNGSQIMLNLRKKTAVLSAVKEAETKLPVWSVSDR
jgi:hypothetical protein